jgi:hypothetical protein
MARRFSPRIFSKLKTSGAIKMPKPSKATKMQKTMHEFKAGNLRSGSKSGPVVQKRSQAVAIGLNQVRKAMAQGRPSGY